MVVGCQLADHMRTSLIIDALDLGQVSCRTLVLVAADDEVSLEHAVAAYQAIPRCRTSRHSRNVTRPVGRKPDLYNHITDTLLTTEPITTLAPTRRKKPR